MYHPQMQKLQESGAIPEDDLSTLAGEARQDSELDFQVGGVVLEVVQLLESRGDQGRGMAGMALLVVESGIIAEIFFIR